MTLESTVNRNRYVGNGATTDFPFTFRAWKTNQVAVFVGNGEAEVDVSAHCSVTLTETGGTVSFSSAPASGDVIEIRRRMPYIQEDDYRNGSRFDGEEIEDRLDQDCAERQDLKLETERCMKVPLTSSLTPEQWWSDLVAMAGNVSAARDLIWSWLQSIGTDTQGNATLVMPDGGSVWRSLSERASDFVFVADYGAVGDGLTDDTLALSRAFAVGGKTFFDKNKKYRITSHLYVSGENFDLNMNGSTLYSDSGYLMVLAPYDTNATEYNGLSNIKIHNGVFDGASLGTVHNNNVLIDNVSFLNSNEIHHIQIFATKNIHINNCFFKGLKGRQSGNYESINIDPGDSGAFPFLQEGSAAYDGTKNKFVFIDNCSFEKGIGNYAYFQDAIGTHYDDAIGTLHENIFVTNCKIFGIELWGVRANSWKNAIIDNCVIETNHFAFDVGYQQRAENICFSNSVIIQNFSIYNERPIHIGPYRCGNFNISNIRYIDTSGTNTNPSDLIHPSALAEGATDTVFSPSYFSQINPARSYLFDAGAQGCEWNSVVARGAKIVKVNPYLTFIETDIEKNVMPESIGRQGVIFSDKNGIELGSMQFTSQADTSTSRAYNTLIFTHNGSMSGSEGHSIFLRETGNGNWEFDPSPSDSVNLGSSVYVWKNIYASTSTISDSDQRLKEDIVDVPPQVVDAWCKVKFKLFKFKSSVSEKGENARIHVGVIAQDIDAAFASEGLDANKFGLFCYDEWNDEYVYNKIIDKEAVLDDSNNVVSEEEYHIEPVKVLESGNKYSVRYEEALALECAYLRSRIDKMQKQIDSITANVAQLTAQQNN